MPQLVINRQYENGEIFFESQMDAANSSIETFFNTTKLDSDNFATGGITEDSFAALSVSTDKLASDSVVSASFDDGDVTTAKILDSAVTTAKINTGAVTNDKFASATIANDKHADRTRYRPITFIGEEEVLTGELGAVVCNILTTSAGSITLTTGGRPVLIELQGVSRFVVDGSGVWTHVMVSEGLSGSTTFNFKRDSTTIFSHTIAFNTVVNGEGFIYIDDVAAGTYTYSLELTAGTNRVHVGVSIYEL